MNGENFRDNASTDGSSHLRAIPGGFCPLRLSNSSIALSNWQRFTESVETLRVFFAIFWTADAQNLPFLMRVNTIQAINYRKVSVKAVPKFKSSQTTEVSHASLVICHLQMTSDPWQMTANQDFWDNYFSGTASNEPCPRFGYPEYSFLLYNYRPNPDTTLDGWLYGTSVF